MRISNRSYVILGLVALLATGGVAGAQNLPSLPQPADRYETATRPVAEPAANRYRVGIACGEVSEALRMHLRLPEDAGLLVNTVVDDSPAGRAGVKRFDVIVEANGTPIDSIFDLVRVVNEARNHEMNLTIIRRGERQDIKVTPEERDVGSPLPRPRRRYLDQEEIERWRNLPPELRRHLDQFEQLEIPGRPGLSWRRILPGIMLDGPNWPRRTLPENFSLHVEKSGEGPAKITVRHGDEEWTVTEDHLDELPKDLRPLVENMLNGSRREMFGLTIPEVRGRRANRMPQDPRQPLPEMEKRFDGLQLQLKELQDAIRSLQEDHN